jgi:hypothetical protein
MECSSKKPAAPETLDLLAKARASGFKIVITTGINESVSFILQFTELLRAKLRRVDEGECVWIQGTLEFYN